MKINRIISEGFSQNWMRINHEDRENYCTVYHGDDDGFMVANIPEYKPAAEFFFKIIKKAELKKLSEKHRHIHITDIASVMSEIDFLGSEPFNFTITGLSIDDLPSDKIASVYKFPIDNSYLVMLVDNDRNSAVVFTSEKRKSANELINKSIEHIYEV